MGEDTFRFKQFTIRQKLSAMKVGTDGVLIGSWTTVRPECKKILDIGTGTGLIAIMMAQRSEKAYITAVEIESAAAKEALFNAVESPWNDRINVICTPIQKFAETEQLFDLIVSNPPYFNGTYKSQQAERMAARHAELLSSDDLLDAVVKMLDRDNGCFSAIFPYETGAVNIAKAADRGLYCNRICNVFPREHSRIKRIMVEFSFKRTTPTSEDLVIIDKESNFTEQYKTVTKDFYLKF